MRSAAPSRLLALMVFALLAADIGISFADTADESKLSHEALLELFPANIDAFTPRIGPSIYSLKEDGTFTYRLFAGKFDDQGTWSIEEEKLCLQFEFLGEGKEVCQSIYRTEPGHYKMLTQDRKEEVIFTVWSEPSAAPKFQE